jgi:general nucleoside transport system permease protein
VSASTSTSASPGASTSPATAWLKKALFTLAAPVLALLFALLVTSVILLISGHQPIPAFQSMWDYGTTQSSLVNTVNLSITYYLAAVAAAIGFRMNLFNIGVDGQYRIAALLAAAVGGALHLPSILHVAIILLVAMIAGAAWAALAGLLKARRGVSEVISTIMLNYIATGVIAYLLTPDRLAVPVAGSNNIGTRPIPSSGQVPGFAIFGQANGKIEGLLFLAVAVGIGYWFLLGRTRFGYDLRATGRSEPAAVASGVNVKRMIVMAMVISGAVAGLVGMPQLLGEVHSYGTDFPTGLGFTGISIALLGRNSAVGMAAGALLWAFLDTSRLILDFNGISKGVITLMQGIAVLSVVIAYELVRRYRLTQQQRDVGRQLGTAEPQPAGAAA